MGMFSKHVLDLPWSEYKRGQVIEVFALVVLVPLINLVPLTRVGRAICKSSHVS